MDITSIFEDGALVDLHINIWTGQKKLRPEDLNLDQVPDIFSLGRKYLVPKENINIFRAIEGQARRVLHNNGFGFPIGTAYFIPKTVLKSVLAKLEEIKSEFFSEVDHLVNIYDTLRNTMSEHYPEHYRTIEPYYPPVHKIKASFDFRYIVYEITIPDITKENITDQALAKYQESLEASMDEFINDVVIQLRSEATDMCNRIIEKISKGDAVSKRSLNTLWHLVDKYRDLNFVGDEKVENMLQDLKKRWLNKDPNDSETDMRHFREALRQISAAAEDVTDISRITGTYKRKIRVA